MQPRVALLKSQIERTLPAAFTVYGSKHEDHGAIPTGIPQVDDAIGGVPLRALTEICGSNLASSGKTSVFVSLLAQATRNHFCALVDAGDNFDPVSGQAARITLPRLLWVRCRKKLGLREGPNGAEKRFQLPVLEQSFKVADILLQSGGFKLIAVDLSGIPQHIVRRVPLSSWFRFSRVIERQPAALVFLTQEPHATSCAGLVLRVNSAPVGHLRNFLSGNLLTQMNINVEIVRGLNKKPVRPASVADLDLPAQEA
jgi:recombination protein RecA